MTRRAGARKTAARTRAREAAKENVRQANIAYVTSQIRTNNTLRNALRNRLKRNEAAREAANAAEEEAIINNMVEQNVENAMNDLRQQAAADEMDIEQNIELAEQAAPESEFVERAIVQNRGARRYAFHFAIVILNIKWLNDVLLAGYLKTCGKDASVKLNFLHVGVLTEIDL